MIIPVNFVNDSNESYDIAVERGVLAEIGRYIDLDRRVLIVTDDGVPGEYANTVATQCGAPTVVCIPEGEASKNFESFRQLLYTMLCESFTRKDCVVAVGGGVVGDLSGFAASCYMRGIDFYNVPTTLLSQIDSSVGGKTAIDFENVKNVVGSFYQPKKVVIDPDVLETLDRRQLYSGLAEAIKMSLTSDAQLFKLIENSVDLNRDIDEIIIRSLKIKRDVVEKDPKETGLRRVLNFGHTIGHAIESLSHGALFHGECVALGMIPMCSPTVRIRLIKVLKKYSLPFRISQSADELMPLILHDKKALANGIVVVYVEDIGTYRLMKVSPEEIRRFMENI